MEKRERRAYVCYEKEGLVHRRTFLLPDQKEVPRCALHGPMKRQPNRPYMKKGKANRG